MFCRVAGFDTGYHQADSSVRELIEQSGRVRVGDRDVKKSFKALLTALSARVVRRAIMGHPRYISHRMRLPHETAERWLSPSLIVVTLLLTACSVSAQQEVQRTAATAIAASQVAQNCRSLIARNPHYQQLANHIPLESVFDATLSQMTDTRFAGYEDVVLLGLWLGDLEKCRHQIVEISLRDFPTALPILVVAWNKDDETFVLLATHKLVWGKAIMAMRTHHAEMLAALAHQALQLSQQASAERQAQLSRRIALFSALTNLAP
jgi:hypothetical protein